MTAFAIALLLQPKLIQKGKKKKELDVSLDFLVLFFWSPDANSEWFTIQSRNSKTIYYLCVLLIHFNMYGRWKIEKTDLLLVPLIYINLALVCICQNSFKACLWLMMRMRACKRNKNHQRDLSFYRKKCTLFCCP